MNKQEFIETLRYYLNSLPEDERSELLRDYEAHFIYGQQNGKTEADIARELGDPLALAREVIGADFIPPPPWAPPRRDTPRTVGVSILLFFLNLIAIPFIAAMWAVFVAICLASFCGFLAPLALIAESLLYDGYAPYKLFLSIGMVGVGMLLAALTMQYGKWLIASTMDYIQWNKKTWKGRS